MLGFAGGTFSHKDLFRYYGMKEERIFLMPLMVNNARFYSKHRFFPDTFTFLYVGRLIKSKGVEIYARSIFFYRDNFFFYTQIFNYFQQICLDQIFLFT